MDSVLKAKEIALLLIFLFEIWSPCDNENDDYYRLGCDAMWSGRSLPTFQRNVMPFKLHHVIAVLLKTLFCALIVRYIYSSLTQFSSTHVINCSLWNRNIIPRFNARSSPHWISCGQSVIRTQFSLRVLKYFCTSRQPAWYGRRLRSLSIVSRHGYIQLTNGRMKLETNRAKRKVCDDFIFWGRYRH
jgi:hypothetical protein